MFTPLNTRDDIALSNCGRVLAEEYTRVALAMAIETALVSCSSCHLNSRQDPWHCKLGIILVEIPSLGRLIQHTVHHQQHFVFDQPHESSMYLSRAHGSSKLTAHGHRVKSERPRPDRELFDRDAKTALAWLTRHS